MSPVVERALLLITREINLLTGLSHPNDEAVATEMLLRLRRAGEILRVGEIVDWARQHGWQPEDARELGALVRRIRAGDQVRVRGGPWWREDIIRQLREEVAAAGPRALGSPHRVCTPRLSQLGRSRAGGGGSAPRDHVAGPSRHRRPILKLRYPADG